ncbi:hypothetical protein [Helicobacter sp.]|uniref:hypothetical protein n=1 Tax=Helicobacter sp. TaxID=218 RepID=UPI002A75C232|nr:hypothetical protein [Helicobacter sp.]MDY2585467.1 hypothetical protein [Helicobacter sp.]
MGLTGRSRKKRQRYRQEKLAQFQAINAQYDLGLTYEQMNAAALSYSDQRVKSEKKWYESGKFWTSLVFSLGTIFITGGITSLQAFNALSTLGRIAYVASYAVSISMLVYGAYIGYKMAILAFDIQTWQNKVNAKKAQNAMQEEKQKSEQLSDSLMNATFEIFPNGSIYKAQAAGDMNSFSPSIAYFGAKGMLGEFKSDVIDEHILNRGHYDNAGNDGFMTNLTGAKEYRTQGGLSPKAQMQIEEKKLQTKAKNTSEGFNKLIEAEFSYYGQGTQELFERIMDKKIQPHARAIADVDFMDKMKNYKRGLMADFSFINPDLLNPLRKKGEMRLWQFEDEFANFEKAQQSGTLEDRARAYLRSINLWIRTLKTYTRTTQDFTYHFSAFIPDSAYKIIVQAPTGLLGHTLDSSSFAMQEFNKIKPQLEQVLITYEKEREPFLKEWWESESATDENKALEKLKAHYENFIATQNKAYYHLKSTTFYDFVTIEEEVVGKDESGQGLRYTYHPFTKHVSGFSTKEDKDTKQQSQETNGAKRATSTKKEERKSLENHLFREGSGQELLERYKTHFKFMDFNHNGSDNIKNLINVNLRGERTSFVNVKLNAVREFWQIPLSPRATQVLGKPLPMDTRLKTFDFSVL